MEELVLALLLLLLGVQEFVQRLAVEALRNRVPPEPRDRDVSVVLRLYLGITVEQGLLSAVERYLRELIRALVD